MPKVLPLLRMLVSGTDGEVVNSITALRLILSKAGLDLHVIVERVALSSVTERQKLYDVDMTTAARTRPRSSVVKRLRLDPSLLLALAVWMTNSTTTLARASTAFLARYFAAPHDQPRSRPGQGPIHCQSVYRGLFVQASSRRRLSKQDGYATFLSGSSPGRSLEPRAGRLK